MMYWYLDFPHRHSTLQCVPVAERAITSWVSCCLLEIFIHLVVHLLVGWTSVALLLQWIFKLDKLLIEQLGGHSFSMEVESEGIKKDTGKLEI